MWTLYSSFTFARDTQSARARLTHLGHHRASSLSPQARAARVCGVGTAKHLRPKGKRGEGRRKGGRNHRQTELDTRVTLFLGAKQSNVNRINVNTVFYPSFGHVSAAGQACCLDCVVERGISRLLCCIISLSLLFAVEITGSSCF